MVFAYRLLFVSIFAFCFLNLAFGATLVLDEVEALKDIANTLGKRDWNFSVDPCSGEEGWADKNPRKGFENAVTCNCSFSNGTICHVVSIVVKALSLPGTLPSELVRLPFLQEIDLTRNYLNGTIPPEWGSLQLVNISVIGNRLTGSIPKELANISTLISFTAEYNQFSGVLPSELGNLRKLERMLLTSNNFSGEIPTTFAKLTTLKDLRIGDNHFIGKIPNFIQNWTNIEKLVMQASGLVGPIPDSISSLENLIDLRISDVNGIETSFPPLSNMKNMKTLILRNCNLTGKLPEYIGQMKTLKNLDLSFNKLVGEIPSTYIDLMNVDYIYLSGNMLTGTIPSWVLEKGDYIDLTYNNFSTVSSTALACQHRNVNLFASSPNNKNNSGIPSCLRNFRCPKTIYSLHINCGGRAVTLNDTLYEEDLDGAGPSSFFQRTNWAFSSTGNFMDDDRSTKTYIWTNESKLFMNDSQLYTQARLSANSLTYHAFCMENGNYTLNLHFAEIMFSDDKTYSSLGRRLFDIYVQGKIAIKDFNIEDEAGGVGKKIVKRIPVIVSENMLEIRLYWAGKGTNGIPTKGVYGPLISAISVNPDFEPPLEPTNKKSSISASIVVGIVVGVITLILLVVGILWWRGYLEKKPTLEQDLRGIDLQTSTFTLKQIKVATNNFDPTNKIGEGGFGPVYKGTLVDGTIIAVKQLSSKSKQGNREFVNEIGLISALQHPHLVKLYGCCIEGNQLLLIYEYMKNNSLARALFGREEHLLELDWPTRQKICIGIARGLAYLHEESRLKIVHRDIKATNVLLDENLNPKISDFGLAKLDEEDNTHISTRIAGTFGYMAPEYAMRGHLTDKADVYSFGIVMLEIVSGRGNTTYRPKEESFYLLDWAHELQEEGDLMELVDPRLGSNLDQNDVISMINVALLCVDASSTARPSMSWVVSMLEGRVTIEESTSSLSKEDENKKAMKRQYEYAKQMDSNESQTRSVSTLGPWTGSSTSAVDLYPINLDSDYFENRN